MRIEIYRGGKDKKSKVDWLGIIGFDKKEKTDEIPSGLCAEIVYEPSNGVLRVWTNGKYHYFTHWQGKQLYNQLKKVYDGKSVATPKERIK